MQYDFKPGDRVQWKARRLGMSRGTIKFIMGDKARIRIGQETNHMTVNIAVDRLEKVDE